MTELEKAARQALEALEVCEVHGYIPVRLTCQAITALRQAIKQQPTNEPVAWANPNDLKSFDMKVRTNGGPLHTVPLYTAPPKRERVGLTEEVVIEEAEWHLGEMQVENCGADNIQAFVRAILAKAKEKNT